jgi:hypothetical protein
LQHPLKRLRLAPTQLQLAQVALVGQPVQMTEQRVAILYLDRLQLLAVVKVLVAWRLVETAAPAGVEQPQTLAEPGLLVKVIMVELVPELVVPVVVVVLARSARQLLVLTAVMVVMVLPAVSAAHLSHTQQAAAAAGIQAARAAQAAQVA